MRSKLRAVGAAVLVFSLACAGGEALDRQRAASAPPRAAAGAEPAADGASGAEAATVLGTEDAPEITEGSNTNWRPIDPGQGGTRPPFSGSAPAVRPSGNGSVGSSRVAAGNAAATGMNPADSSASSPDPGEP